MKPRIWNEMLSNSLRLTRRPLQYTECISTLTVQKLFRRKFDVRGWKIWIFSYIFSRPTVISYCRHLKDIWYTTWHHNYALRCHHHAKEWNVMFYENSTNPDNNNNLQLPSNHGFTDWMIIILTCDGRCRSDMMCQSEVDLDCRQQPKYRPIVIGWPVGF